MSYQFKHYENKDAYKRLKKAIGKTLDEAYSDGYSDGENDAEHDYEVGFEAGVSAERERIKTIFDMNIQWALESNKGSDVVFFTKAKQIIEPIDVDLSPEAYQRSLENDGF
jgi:hypothetical protein